MSLKGLQRLYPTCIMIVPHQLFIEINNYQCSTKLTIRGYVSDFGTARFLHPDSSNQTLVAGTYGYIAPGECYFLLQNHNIFCHSRIDVTIYF